MGWWDLLDDLINRGKTLNPLPIGSRANPGSYVGEGGAAGGSLNKNILGDVGRGAAGAVQNLNDAIGGMSGAVGEWSAPSLYDQLQNQLAGIQPQYTPLDQLKAQAQSTVNAQYDPQISELLRQISGTKDRAQSNTKEVKGMYGALAQDLAAQIPGITAQMKQNQDDVTNRYKSAQADLQSQYDQQKNAQQNTLQQLGIQAASQDAGQQAATDQAYFQNSMAQDKNQTLDALAQQGNAQTDYQQNISNSSLLAGNNAAADIASQLEQYLQGANGQVGDLRAAKNQQLQALISQLQQSDYDRAQQNYQHNFDNLMAMNKFQLDAQGQQNNLDLALQKLQMQMQQQQGQNSPFRGTSGMTGMSNFLAEKYPNDPTHASQVSNLISSVLSNPEVQSGKHNNAPITNEYLIELLKQAAAQQGIQGGADLNNAIDGILAYKGQLR